MHCGLMITILIKTGSDNSLVHKQLQRNFIAIVIQRIVFINVVCKTVAIWLNSQAVFTLLLHGSTTYLRQMLIATSSWFRWWLTCTMSLISTEIAISAYFTSLNITLVTLQTEFNGLCAWLWNTMYNTTISELGCHWGSYGLLPSLFMKKNLFMK